MSGLGNTVDTDLVGELVEVYKFYGDEPTKFPQCRGRVRAVTTSQSGGMIIWLHMEDEDCVGKTKYYADEASLHDVIAMHLGETNHLIMRLVRDGIKS